MEQPQRQGSLGLKVRECRDIVKRSARAKQRILAGYVKPMKKVVRWQLMILAENSKDALPSKAIMSEMKQADAVQASIQALFTAVPTWLSLPKDRWPAARHKQFWQPMVPMLLALYGHPDSHHVLHGIKNAGCYCMLFLGEQNSHKLMQNLQSLGLWDPSCGLNGRRLLSVLRCVSGEECSSHPMGTKNGSALILGMDRSFFYLFLGMKQILVLILLRFSLLAKTAKHPSEAPGLGMNQDVSRLKMTLVSCWDLMEGSSRFPFANMNVIVSVESHGHQLRSLYGHGMFLNYWICPLVGF